MGSYIPSERLVDVKPAPARRSEGSESRSTKSVQKPRIRVTWDDQPVALGTQSQDQLMQAVQKPCRRVMSEAQSVALVPRKVLSEPRLDLNPLVRIHKGRSSYRKTSTPEPLETETGKKLPPETHQISQRKLDPLIRTCVGRSSPENTSTHGPLEIEVGEKLLPENDRGDSVDTVTKLSKIRKVTYDRTRPPSVVHGNSTTDEDTWNSQKRKYFKVIIKRLKDFMAGKFGANVRKVKNPLIKKHLMGNGAFRVSYWSNYVNDHRIIHQVHQDFLQTKELGIRYVAEGDDATNLVHKAGPPLPSVPSKSQHQDEDIHDALASLLDEFKDLDAPKYSDPSRESVESVSSTRSSPEDGVIRPATVDESRTSNSQPPKLMIRFYPSGTPGPLRRHYSTATVSQEDCFWYVTTY